MPPQLIADYLREEAQKAKDSRHEAMRDGATDEHSISWFSAALRESYYNALRTASADETQSITELMEGWLLPALNFQEADVVALSVSYPPCTANVIVASEQYSSNYKVTVCITVFDVIEKIEVLLSSGGTTVGYDRQVREKAFFLWLKNANLNDARASQIPADFYSKFNRQLHELATKNDALVICPACNGVATLSVDTVERQSSGITSVWTEEWRCSAGHLLYQEEHTLYLHRVAPIVAPGDVQALADRALIEPLWTDEFNGYLVITHAANEQLKAALKTNDSIQQFVSRIEKRIKANDLASAGMASRVNLSRAGAGFSPNSRIVVDAAEVVVFTWHPK